MDPKTQRVKKAYGSVEKGQSKRKLLDSEFCARQASPRTVQDMPLTE
jgi:hypothetical protein